MAIGLLPTKGIPLPFLSFGGSSLLSTLLGIGLLLSVSRQGRDALA
jgi:cell division protein FtsW